MRKTLTFSALILTFGLLMTSCQTDKPGSASVPQMEGLSADFEAFYELFHGDSSFQMEHIAWPLSGNLRLDSNGQSTDITWTEHDWLMHKPLELGEEFVREIEASQDDLVIERVKSRAGAYIIERRFAKLGNTWYLIYYRQADMGPSSVEG